MRFAMLLVLVGLVFPASGCPRPDTEGSILCNVDIECPADHACEGGQCIARQPTVDAGNDIPDGGPMATDGGEDAGPDGPKSLFIGPDGLDSQEGSREQPLRTFRRALSRLLPGDTLTLLSGDYGTLEGSGYLIIDCDESSTACDGAPCPNGTPDAPITLRADVERQAHIQGDGTIASVVVAGCSNWRLLGLAASGADTPGPNPPQGHVLLIAESENIEVSRFLGRLPNRYLSAQVIRIAGSNHVLVEESEAYDFHAVGFYVNLSDDVVLRRNYLNSRARPDLLSGAITSDVEKGDTGIYFFSDSTNGLAENNINEGNGSIATTGGSTRFFGNISFNSFEGFALVHSISFDREAVGNVMENNVAYANEGRGFRITSQEDLVLRRNTSLENEGDGIRIDNAHSLPNCDSCDWTVTPSATITDHLSVDNLADGFDVDQADDFTELILDTLNAFGNTNAAYAAGTESATNATTVDPELGGCVAIIPASSPMASAGTDGGILGANVQNRYQDGVLTEQPLWDATDSAFPCGAQVEGINDTAGGTGTICADVHTRLGFVPNGCVLP